jgi:hypothetical protein
VRRTAMATLTAGVVTTALAPAATPASADTGFWRAAGLPGVDAFGVYRSGRSGVRLSFYLRDRKKDRYGPAVRFAFTGRRRSTVRVVALPRGRRAAWRTVSAPNTGHLYAQECTGAWHGRAFQIKKCGGWRRRY